MAYICPKCSLVIEASDPLWMAEHLVRFHPDTSAPRPVEALREIAQTLATNHKWRSALTLEDAVFLHQLEIDPT